MAAPQLRVVLVSGKDRTWTRSLQKSLSQRGVEVVEAHNCWSAELAGRLHDASAVVIDGGLLCDFVSPDRPGPVLALDAELPAVVFNAQELDEAHRSAALSHRGATLEGEDADGIARRVGELLPTQAP